VDKELLKKELTRLKKSNFVFDQAYDVERLSDDMFVYIGDTDSELRDKLIYHAYYYLITNGYLSNEYLEELVCKCMDKLFTGIGLREDDTVFTRSFTSLVISLILFADNQKFFLSKECVLKIKDTLCTYITEEQDIRGYVEGKGWAHSIAHVADAFAELAGNHHLEVSMYEELIDVLVRKICEVSEVYMDEEEERVMAAIGTMLERGLSEVVLVQRIRNHYKWVPTITMNECSKKYMNRRNFLRSLFVHAQKEKYIRVEKEVSVLLEEVRDMYYQHG
jgi:hypothetical protein